MTDKVFTEAIVAMTRTLYRVCYAHLRNPSDREDTVQETLCRAWNKRSQLRNDRYLSTWIIRILINECRNIQRCLQNDEELDNIPAPQLAETELHDAIMSLPQKLRLPVVLHYMEGFSVKEVSDMLKIPQGTVKTRLAAARRELKLLLLSGEGFSTC